jgi:hypothetical protein
VSGDLANLVSFKTGCDTYPKRTLCAVSRPSFLNPAEPLGIDQSAAITSPEFANLATKGDPPVNAPPQCHDWNAGSIRPSHAEQMPRFLQPIGIDIGLQQCELDQIVLRTATANAFVFPGDRPPALASENQLRLSG